MLIVMCIKMPFAPGVECLMYLEWNIQSDRNRGPEKKDAVSASCIQSEKNISKILRNILLSGFGEEKN